MDQQLNNIRNEFLGPLLANPADYAHLHVDELERLVNDYPQSGILQALFAYASEEKNLKQASVYFNPRSLFKLINDPATLAAVPPGKVMLPSGEYAKSPGPAEELPLTTTFSIPAEEEHQGEPGGNFFSDPGASIDFEEHLPHRPIVDEEKPPVEPETGSLVDPVVSHDINAPEETESYTQNGTASHEYHEEQPGEALAEGEPFAKAESAVPDEMPVEQEVETLDQWSEANMPFEPPAETERTVDTDALAVGHEPKQAETIADDHTFNDGHQDKNNIYDEPNTVTPESDLHEDIIAGSSRQEIEDEVYDEIVGIENIDTTVKLTDPITETPIEEVGELDNTEERLIVENIVNTDFFVFDDALNGHTVANEPPAEASTDFKEKEPPNNPPAEPAEHQDVSKYNDDKMPYTFMWWLDRTRQQHAGIYQPYIKPEEAKTEAPPKKSSDELQQQYYENIFHLTSVDDLQKNIPHPPFTARPKLKENVIIERFIKEEPQIKPQSSDKLDNENKAKKSSEDRDELVTETLAMIYTDQMLYHKAIAAYKKLILKFPEKSSYFAEKIEQLEKKTN